MNANARPAWYRRTWVIATLTGIVGIGVGGASMSTQDVTKTAEYTAVADARDEAKSDLEATKSELDTAKTDLETAAAKLTQVEGDIPAREEAVTTKEAQLRRRESAVKATEKSVRKREKAVGIVEREIEANTISDGTYEVGVDIKAGTYKTKGTGDTCYWARLSSPGGDIKANNLGEGPSVVSANRGDFLELNCGGADWVLQR